MDRLYQKGFAIYQKYKEVIKYLVFGGLSTGVNIVSYFIASNMLQIDEIISNIISWICAVLFAYITNKLFVFESKTEGLKATLKEMISFFICRIASGVIDVGLFAFMIKTLMINDMVAKIVTQILVIIANYLFSKMIIFKTKEKTQIEK